MVAMPQNAAGSRTLPAASLPNPRGEPQLAISAASPPLLAAGGARQVVRIAGGAEQQIVALEGKQQVGQIGARDRDRPGLPQARHQRGIFGGGRASRRPSVPAVHTAPAISMESLMLNGTPHSGPRGISSVARGRERLLGEYFNRGVNPRIHLGDPVQVRLYQFDRGNAALADQARQVRGGEAEKFVHQSPSLTDQRYG